jgi:hypothetical protein
MAVAATSTATVRVSNIPPSTIATGLLDFFDSAVAADGAAYACEIVAARPYGGGPIFSQKVALYFTIVLVHI